MNLEFIARKGMADRPLIRLLVPTLLSFACLHPEKKFI